MAAALAAQLTHCRLPSPFTARDVYRNEWAGLTEPRVVQGALACLAELGWLRSDAGRARACGRPSVGVPPHPRLSPGASGAGRGRRRPTGPADQRDASEGFVSFVGSSPWRGPLLAG